MIIFIHHKVLHSFNSYRLWMKFEFFKTVFVPHMELIMHNAFHQCISQSAKMAAFAACFCLVNVEVLSQAWVLSLAVSIKVCQSTATFCKDNLNLSLLIKETCVLINVLPSYSILYYIANSQQIMKTESLSWKGMQFPFHYSSGSVGDRHAICVQNQHVYLFFFCDTYPLRIDTFSNQVLPQGALYMSPSKEQDETTASQDRNEVFRSLFF